MASLAQLSGVDSFERVIALLEKKVGTTEACDLILSDSRLIEAEEVDGILADIDEKMYGEPIDFREPWEDLISY